MENRGLRAGAVVALRSMASMVSSDVRILRRVRKDCRAPDYVLIPTVYPTRVRREAFI